MHTLIVGLTFTNCKNNCPIVDRRKFDQMLQGLDGSLTSILIVCATAYTKDIVHSYGASGSVGFAVPETYKNAKHALLLNPTTPEMHASFFGFENKLALKQNCGRCQVEMCPLKVRRLNKRAATASVYNSLKDMHKR
ncbi:hypothetical protein PC128_g19639 [Phytophthora cactorum]|nr:hypothetical protein PC128_g19639 [Phytophthora cactorum]